MIINIQLYIKYVVIIMDGFKDAQFSLAKCWVNLMKAHLFTRILKARSVILPRALIQTFVHEK